MSAAQHDGLDHVVDVRHTLESLDVVVTDLRLPGHGGQEGELLHVGQRLTGEPEDNITDHKTLYLVIKGLLKDSPS